MSKIKKAWRALRSDDSQTFSQKRKRLPQNPALLLGDATSTDYLALVLEASQEYTLKAFAIPLKWNQPVRVGIPEDKLNMLFSLLANRGSEFSVTFRGKTQLWRNSRTLTLEAWKKFYESPEYELFIEEYGQPQAYYLHPHTIVPQSRADIIGITSILEIDVWQKTQNGTYHSELTNLHTSEIDLFNATFTKIAVRGEKKYDSVEDFALPTLDQISFPIDVVYLWVNGSDAQWLDKKNQALSRGSENFAPEAVSDSRFRDHNELLYSIRSIEVNASWVNHIWIVTDNQIPEWLNLNNSRVTIVDHKQILPAEALPNFNSHALSANIHKIPGLSEHFLYMNDDVFLGAPTDPSFWFAPNGTSRLHYTQGKRPGASVRNKTVPVQARENAINLAHRYAENNGYQMRNLQHGPHPISRSIMEEVWEEWGSELYATTLHQFRSPEDIEPIWLYNIYSTAMRYSNEGNSLSYAYILMDEATSIEKLAELNKLRNKYVFCLNDGHSSDEDLNYTKLSDEERHANYCTFLESYFSKKSSYEK